METLTLNPGQPETAQFGEEFGGQKISRVASPAAPPEYTVPDYVAGVRAGDRVVLARAITLIESSARHDEAMAQEVLRQLLSATGKAKRIGITGVPGVGKSTFIENFGCRLVSDGHKVAVLTIDPSSMLSGGSILGDKTRMERLSREPRAFIRPSPSGGNAGGVARRTRETMLLCEAAGFDVIIVESVGVGQGEVTLRSMVDFFLLLLLPGAGDDLQGIKKGIMEMADAVLINKADGDNLQSARLARAEQEAALHCLREPTPGWRTEARLCSARTGEGLPEIWATIERFYNKMNGAIASRRQKQSLEWLAELVREELLRRFYDDATTLDQRRELENAVLAGRLTAPQAAAAMLAVGHDLERQSL